jgi:hypothetical protein
MLPCIAAARDLRSICRTDSGNSASHNDFDKLVGPQLALFLLIHGFKGPFSLPQVDLPGLRQRQLLLRHHAAVRRLAGAQPPLC